MKFAFIAEHLQSFQIQVVCQVLAVSRSGYYAWRSRPDSARAQRREELAAKIQRVHEQNRRVYGSPRVHQALLAQGQSVAENTVAEIMQERQIRAKARKKFVPRTTDSTHARPMAENVLDRQFQADRPNQKWAADITCIPTDQGWLYLAGVFSA